MCKYANDQTRESQFFTYFAPAVNLHTFNLHICTLFLHICTLPYLHINQANLAQLVEQQFRKL